MTHLFHNTLGRLVLALLAVSTLTCATASAAPDLAPLDQWLEKQENTRSLQAEFTQTRKLKTFNKPLVSEGKLSFMAPEYFRWEIEKPAPSIAIFGPEKVTVVYPNLDRAEVMAMEDISKTKWADTFELIKSGFPRSRKELERLFKIEGLEDKGKFYELRLSLKKRSSENAVREARVYFRPNEAAIVATELELSDGSLIRNDFKSVKINPTLTGSTFDQSIPAGTKVTEPLK